MQQSCSFPARSKLPWSEHWRPVGQLFWIEKVGVRKGKWEGHVPCIILRVDERCCSEGASSIDVLCLSIYNLSMQYTAYKNLLFSTTYKSTYSSKPIPSNLPLSFPNSTNSLTLSSPKCPLKCLSYFAIISGFASSLLNL